MKKYLKLTTLEAINHFLLKDKTLVPETSAEIRQQLDELADLKSNVCLTITLPTHRTKPDYHQDVIVLKNQIVEAENKLHTMVDKRLAWTIMENVREAQETIDFSLNLDSMVIYANEHFSSVLKLPVELPAEVMIGSNFDFRPLYKTRQQNRRYYVMTISRQKIRLLEIFNDKLVQEYTNEDFPFINHDYYTDEWLELAQDTFMENQIKEYFNDADKRLQKYENRNPLPIIFMGDVKSVAYFQEQMDKDYPIIGEVQGGYDEAPVHQLINLVCPVVELYRKNKQEEYLDDIRKGESGLLLSVDPAEIYRLAIAGNAGTLYLGNSYMLQDEITDWQLNRDEEFIDPTDKNQLLMELLKTVNDNGGKIIFMEDDLLTIYGGIILVKRYN